MGTPRPATADARAPILGVAQLEANFARYQHEVRNIALGSDTFLAKSGYVDTTNGSVVTAPKGLEIVPKKEELNVKDPCQSYERASECTNEKYKAPKLKEISSKNTSRKK